MPENQPLYFLSSTHSPSRDRTGEEEFDPENWETSHGAKELERFHLLLIMESFVWVGMPSWFRLWMESQPRLSFDTIRMITTISSLISRNSLCGAKGKRDLCGRRMGPEWAPE